MSWGLSLTWCLFYRTEYDERMCTGMNGKACLIVMVVVVGVLVLMRIRMKVLMMLTSPTTIQVYISFIWTITGVEWSFHWHNESEQDDVCYGWPDIWSDQRTGTKSDGQGEWINIQYFNLLKVIQSLGMGTWIWFKWTYWKHMRPYNIQWSLSRLKSTLKL